MSRSLPKKSICCKCFEDLCTNNKIGKINQISIVLSGFFRGYILTVFRISLDIGFWAFSQIFGYEISILPILSGNGTEQPVGTESETLQIQETAAQGNKEITTQEITTAAIEQLLPESRHETVTQNKETTTQEITTAAIEQLLPDVAMISTSSTQQIPRSKHGRKPKNSSLEQPVGTKSEILEQVTSINEQPVGIEEQLQSSSLPVVSIPKRE
ncbi:unnamed protein product [Rhizophagus irregularis]|nr:unnamed protein product [Rhizophagus irregularis]